MLGHQLAPTGALAAYGVEKWGRRPTLIGFCLLSALGCLLFVAAGTAMLIGVSLLIMSFALLGPGVRFMPIRRNSIRPHRGQQAWARPAPWPGWAACSPRR